MISESVSNSVMSYSLPPHGPGSSDGILQARILEWVAIPFSIPFPSLFPYPKIELVSPALQVESIPTEPPGKPNLTCILCQNIWRLESLKLIFPSFHCPIFPVLFLKPPNLVFYYFPSILSMHEHVCYVNHLVFCVYATPSFYQVVGDILYSKYWLSRPLSWWEICFAKNCEQKCEMRCCLRSDVPSLLWGPLDLEHRCGAKFKLHTTFHGSKA